MTEQSGAVSKPKVLLAEDNPTVRKGIENFLNKWGYEPVEADNGDAAWDTLENDHSIRMAIVDWNLPGLSGIQICQRLRTRINAPYVYAIMFSSRNSYEEQIMALDGGADDYIVKPCKPSELRARLGVGRRITEVALNQLLSNNSPSASAPADNSLDEKNEPPADVDAADKSE